MNKRKSIFILFFITGLVLSQWVSGQITAPGSDASDQTNYPTFPETDDIFIFCTTSQVENIGVLRATTQLTGTKTFLWELYNNQAAAFEFYFSESSEGQTSEITGLVDGCYRITITQGASSEISRAWVFNNWTVSSGFVSDSNCESFKLNGEFETAELSYFDLTDNTELEIFKDVKVQWKDGEEIIAAVLNPQIYDPPAENTDYTLRVYDKYDCEGTAKISYESVVTKAMFSVEANWLPNSGRNYTGETPLEVSFINESENGDAGQYEWFFFRDLDEIKREGENSEGPIDSIMIVAYDDNPVYTYESSGTYMVKLVSKKTSETETGLLTCVDTFYLDDYIIADTSWIQVPNVFTPNGDGTNEEFVVMFSSMKTIKIAIFNRWGKRIHYWKSDDIRGFEGTWQETVWDGRIMGGRYASPGVYYYTVVGEGRDGKKRRKGGFFHLFRGKD